MRQALAWVRYRDRAFALSADADALFAEQLFGVREPVAGRAELQAALREGRIAARGARPESEWETIPSAQWLELDIASRDASRHRPYLHVQIRCSDLLRVFPPLEHSGHHLARLPDARLKEWWWGLAEKDRGQSQSKLLEVCRAAFPEHSVARQRIRELTPNRKRGPKPLRRK